MLIGPNTGLGHSSMVYMIESQTRYLLDALRTVDAAGAVAIDTRQDRRRFNADLQRRFAAPCGRRGVRELVPRRAGPQPHPVAGLTPQASAAAPAASTPPTRADRVAHWGPCSSTRSD